MTFQEKYAKKREEAQKALQDKLNTVNVETYADTVFNAICDKLDKEVSTEYDVEKIKTNEQTCLADSFAVRVKFNTNCIMVDGFTTLAYAALSLQDRIVKILTEKLREVGIDFKVDDRDPSQALAYLKFNSNNNSDS